jgi:hypothetical protein
MRLPRFRFTVRTVLLGVAIVGALIGFCDRLAPITQRWGVYVRRASAERKLAADCLKSAEGFEDCAALGRRKHAERKEPPPFSCARAYGSWAEYAEESERSAIVQREAAAHHSRIAESFLRAAWLPWSDLDVGTRTSP